ncbi:MAG: FGGY-family carbohydrate kinase, partial [Candidatus Poribacteria bacterium]|nr:FGGY-family carbohydrate kinase [Candidatus Poribacteria bacterium]
WKPDDIVAAGLSGHFTIVFLDAEGKPARPAITWQDARAVEEAEYLSHTYHERESKRLLGMHAPFSPAMPAAKFRWVAQNEPEVMANVHWVCHAKDYVGLQLCGEVCSDVQSFVGVVNARTGAHDDKYLADLGLHRSNLPRWTPAFRNAGYTTKEAREMLGVRIGLPVIVGWVDAFCSMLATGVYRDGAAFDYAGTSEIVGLLASAIPERHAGLLSLPFDRKHAVVYGLTNCGADALAWAKDTLGVETFEGLLELAGSVDASLDLPLFLPYLDGERSPVWDAEARAVWLNVHRRHGRAELAFSVLEGVAFAVRQILEAAAADAGRRVSELVISGGGARSDVWSQIRADVMGFPSQTVEEIETGALGAAMLAAVGYGEHESMADAAGAMTRLGKRFESRADRHAIHTRRYAVYQKVYSATKELRF